MVSSQYLKGLNFVIRKISVGIKSKIVLYRQLPVSTHVKKHLVEKQTKDSLYSYLI